ncbi:MAG: DNA polymerase III subunit beta [Nitrospirae bacterium]|nr:DNA polymerase III subunit beta [Nitrospirota bacterium]
MKIQVKREEILKVIQRTQGIVEKKSTMPILSNLLIETEKGGIDIVATDLEIGIRDKCPATVLEEGGVALSARKIFEILREINGEDILIEKENNNWVKITNGHSEFRIMGIGKEEFPALPEAKEATILTLDADLLNKMLKKTIYASGESDSRYVLNGLLFALRPAAKNISLTIVGTDGHRLAIINKSIEANNTGLKGEQSVIIPKKAAIEIKKLLDEGDETLSIGLDKNHIIFKRGNTILLSRLIEGNYPSYEQVLVTTHDKKIALNRDLFMGALRRVSILSKEKTNAVKLDIEKDKILLSTSNPDMGEAKEELKASYKGESLAIGFNARYLIDALGAMDSENITIDLYDPLSPAFLMEEGETDYKCVVMPMRI